MLWFSFTCHYVIILLFDVKLCVVMAKNKYCYEFFWMLEGFKN